MQEIDRIPSERLVEVLDFVHRLRLDIETDAAKNPTMKLAGVWSDMDDKDFDDFLADVRRWRTIAFDGRPRLEQDDDEQGAD